MRQRKMSRDAIRQSNWTYTAHFVRFILLLENIRLRQLVWFLNREQRTKWTLIIIYIYMNIYLIIRTVIGSAGRGV